MAKESTGHETNSYAPGDKVELAELEINGDENEVCCGGPPPPKSNPFERPGYEMQHYIRAFLVGNSVDIPLIKTQLERKDHVGTLLTRIGFGRDHYKVSPGLYGVGNPSDESPVIVTANYKLTFDSVRRELENIDCWLLVLDTCGVNVWCAAGKQTFSTEEIVRLVEKTRLAERVAHRKIIIPQLGATGVAAHEVKMKSGFRVIYGPIQASDLQAFIQNDFQATEEMRAITFSMRERFVLIPVEFYLFSKKIWWIFPLLFLISGVGTSVFSIHQAWHRGILCSVALLLGGVLGAMLMPLLLPWLPGRSFSLKGLCLGIVGGIACISMMSAEAMLDKVALLLIVSSVSSYLAMNFTGSSPYTSPSGVEKEMKIAIPCQALAIVFSILFWLISPFVQ